MTLEFPNSPSVGDTYQTTNVIYTWDGEKWTTSGSQVLYATKQYVDSKSVIGIAAWAKFFAPIAGAVASYNVESIVRANNQNNLWQIKFINPMANNDYAVTATVNENSDGTVAWCRVRDMTPDGFRIATHTTDGSPSNETSFGFAVYAQTSL